MFLRSYLHKNKKTGGIRVFNHEKPILIFNTGKVKDVNTSKDQEKLNHENLQFSQN